MKRMIKDERGFTLIEMVLVVLIIAALLLIFIPNIANTREKAISKSEEAVVKVVEMQMEAYMLDTGASSVTAEQLKDEGYIDEKQLEVYNRVHH
ncbi:competence type IV pilus major pilin ComGC [Allofustis seminis]|uniref:competence type IV pilus major pilin ComGC n=1 Tax=Allofustis seminis TaxID=166939 RepID=UPI000368F5AD|nr:competence type IV pilus major pilin ComGC [Allofustis seminis]